MSTNRFFVLFLSAVGHSWWSSYIICAGWRTFTLHKGNARIICQVVFMVRCPRGSDILLPLLSLEVAAPEITLAVVHMQVRLTSGS